MALDLQNVGFTVGGKRILDGVSWSIPRGSHAAILGHNGCGKSTLLRLITGYYFPSVGAVHCLGETLGHVDVHELRRRIGSMDPSNPYLAEGRLTVLDVVMTGHFGTLSMDFQEATPAQTEEAVQALTQVGLAGKEQQIFATLSSGEKRRTLLARVLIAQPEMLLLDEPTAGLDLLSRETMLATLDRLWDLMPGITTVLVTHHLEELSPRTDRVMLMSHGKKLTDGRPEEVLTSDWMEKAFGVPVQVSNHQGRWSWHVEPQVWKQLLHEK